ncbi:CHRD domain-containing protein [Calidithermus chliarophilus]|uniref:CHRD domain-containing protein n=1 Tax=Calidithermus chliarophilus TaxID=52023 RepID=UPI001C54C260|nr:CHRD domain-containing protein [Calidithermus chliarophilus]
MKAVHWWALAVVGVFALAGCARMDPATGGVFAIQGVGSDFVAQLSGGEEVPANDSRARGNALFGLSADGSELHYKLIVANIENVVASHIHLAPAGANGPVVAFLYGPAAPGGGRSDGVLAEGTITAANLVGPLAGHPLSDLIAAMEAGNAYVNVHTNDGVAPPNTGPGDIPSGEVRGQIRATH